MSGRLAGKVALVTGAASDDAKASIGHIDAIGVTVSPALATSGTNL
jgi:hypothetical protein